MKILLWLLATQNSFKSTIVITVNNRSNFLNEYKKNE